MEKRFENQGAIVTGGADGIGKAVVERLAGGGKVTIFDLNESLGEEAGFNTAFTFDLIGGRAVY